MDAGNEASAPAASSSSSSSSSASASVSAGGADGDAAASQEAADTVDARDRDEVWMREAYPDLKMLAIGEAAALMPQPGTPASSTVNMAATAGAWAAYDALQHFRGARISHERLLRPASFSPSRKRGLSSRCCRQPA